MRIRLIVKTLYHFSNLKSDCPVFFNFEDGGNIFKMAMYKMFKNAINM
ncbi:hypothetical protein SAMN04487893_11919 [Myroides guanonis]|uniref:Uncharacterized protein n=1 Tax=Myroides guanonis TaxID=1150112 RepID=A0A1I3UQM8_9FLAO|nr:hypothetical protein SAMN04487893_11919 [Myroides guanonis]